MWNDEEADTFMSDMQNSNMNNKITTFQTY